MNGLRHSVSMTVQDFRIIISDLIRSVAMLHLVALYRKIRIRVDEQCVSMAGE